MTNTNIYIRVSGTLDDGITQLVKCLNDVGVHACDRVDRAMGIVQSETKRGYIEVEGVRVWVERSGAKGDNDNRPLLKKMLGELKAGDTLIVTELSRLTRKVLTAVLMLDELQARSVRVKSLREGLDYSTPMGKAMAIMTAMFAQLEHDRIKERIREGVKRAKEGGTRSGKPIGRPRVLTMEKKIAARRMKESSESVAKIARELHMSASSVRRALELQG